VPPKSRARAAGICQACVDFLEHEWPGFDQLPCFGRSPERVRLSRSIDALARSRRVSRLHPGGRNDRIVTFGLKRCAGSVLTRPRASPTTLISVDVRYSTVCGTFSMGRTHWPGPEGCPLPERVTFASAAAGAEACHNKPSPRTMRSKRSFEYAPNTHRTTYRRTGRNLTNLGKKVWKSVSSSRPRHLREKAVQVASGTDKSDRIRW